MSLLGGHFIATGHSIFMKEIKRARIFEYHKFVNKLLFVNKLYKL